MGGSVPRYSICAKYQLVQDLRIFLGVEKEHMMPSWLIEDMTHAVAVDGLQFLMILKCVLI